MTTGIHHITAIASNAKRTYEFYSRTLGLRLVKKTVNQDDVGTYHLFFGDKLGHPGMDLTFFIFQPSQPGRRGNGLVTTISLAVPARSIPFWKKRFESLHVRHESPSERFGYSRLVFFDDDDQRLELVGVPEKELESGSDVWTTPEVTMAHAIHAFHSATLQVADVRLVEPVLRVAFGYELIAKHTSVTVYGVHSPHGRAKFLEVQEDPTGVSGRNAAGTVHHIAFRVRNDAEQEQLRLRIKSLGIYTTEVIDRFYFKSVYFRIPAGILFELATDGPGFTADENAELLGAKLALPPFLESQRAQIEEHLPVLQTK